MAEKIRGLTVEFDADFSEFKKGMKQADSEISSVQKQLRSLQSSLQIEFDGEKFKKSQELLQQAITSSGQKVDLLKSRLKALEAEGVTDDNRKEFNYLSEQLAKTELSAQKLELQLKKLNQMKFDNLANNFNKVGSAFTNAGNSLRTLSMTAGATAVAMGKLGSDAVKTGDEIQTLATKYDMTAEAIQKWQYVALQSDVENATLYKSFQKLNTAMSSQLYGTVNNATKALDSLGISYDKFANSDEAFEALLLKLSSMSSQTEQLAYATNIFGERFASELIPLFQQGEDAVSNYLEEFQEVGYLSDDQAKKLSDFDNVLNKIKAQFANVGTQIGASFLPLMEKLSTVVSEKIVPKLQELSAWFNNLTVDQQSMIFGILGIVTALAPLLIMIGKISTGVGGLIKLIGTLGPAMAGPLGIVIGIIALLGILYTKNENFRNSINSLLSVLMQAFIPTFQVIERLLSAIMPLFNTMVTLLGNQLSRSIDFLIKPMTILANIIGVIYDLLQPVMDLVDTIFEKINKIYTKIGKVFGLDLSNEPPPPSPSNNKNSVLPSTDVQSLIDNKSFETIKNNTTSNNNYQVQINVNAEKGVDVDELTDEIAREFVAKVQSQQ